MAEKGLRLAKTDGAFFSKITTTITKLLIPTKIGINGMLISMKRNNVIKTYYDYINHNEKSKDSKANLEKKYENAVVLYLEALDKYIMESVYKRVKNKIATTYEENALSRYYNVVHLKETQYVEYKYKKQEFLLELDYESLKSNKKEKMLDKYKTFYADKMNSLYKGLLKNYSVQLADKVISENEESKQRIYNDIFENLEKYTTNILPIKIEEGSEVGYKDIVYHYDKFNTFLTGKLDKRDIIEKKMILLGISRKLFTHSLPLVVAEQCYESLLKDNRHLIISSPNNKKQDMAYQQLIALIEDYKVNLLSTKIYWENPKDKEEYKEFWDKYQEIEKEKNTSEEKAKKKEILFIKSDIKQIEGTGLQAKHIIRYYKKKLVQLGVMKHLKNTYTECTSIKLKGTKQYRQQLITPIARRTSIKKSKIRRCANETNSRHKL